MRPSAIARATAASSITLPRAVLRMMAFGYISASCASDSMYRVSSFSTT
jgi:hypothetical protein